MAAGVFSTFKIHVRKFFAAISWLVRSSLPWCFFRCGRGCFPNFQNTHYGVFWCDFVACPSFTAMVFQCGRVVFSAQVSEDFSRHVREFFAAISRLVRPSPPWRFSVAGCCFSTSFLRISEDDFAARPSFTAIVFQCGGEAGFSSRNFYGFLKGTFFFFGAISWLVCPSLPCVSM